MGTVNVLARDFRLSGNVMESVKKQVTGRVVPLDLGKIDSSYFVNVASIGFDAEGIRRIHQPGNTRSAKGVLAYADAIARSFQEFVPFQAQVHSNNETWNLGPTVVSIFNNTPSYGPIILRPDASFQDGRLDFSVLLEKAKILGVVGLPFNLWNVLNPHLLYKSSTEFTIEADRHVAVQMDGEPYHPQKVLRVSAVHHALNVLTPS